jgi:hypothetical protein
VNVCRDSRPSQCATDSLVEEALAALHRIDPKWRVDIGVPDDSPGWIGGTDFARAKEGHSLSCSAGSGNGFAQMTEELSRHRSL